MDCAPDSPRYSRHLLLVGEGGMERLVRSTVAIVGLGGLGSIVSLYLAGAGVGRLIMIDGDVVEDNNLNRQLLYDEASIGLPKAPLAARRVRSLNSCVEAVPIQSRIESLDDALRLLEGADLVVDAVDNWETRLILDRAARELGIGLIHAAVERFYGQLLQVPPRGGVRLDTIAPRGGGRRCMQVLGPAVGVVASLEAMLAIDALLGRYSYAGKLIVVDASLPEITVIPLKSVQGEG